MTGTTQEKRPTIEELERILAQPPGTYKIELLPNGEVRSYDVQERRWERTKIIAQMAARRQRRFASRESDP